MIADTDRHRAQFIRENFQQSDSNPLLYDLVINTAEITLETAAELVLHAVGAKFPHVLEGKAAAPAAAARAHAETQR